jgi:hypothetical protein
MTGLLACGSTAAVGTGAFTSSQAERNVEVAIADDNDAYLTFDATSDLIRANTSGGEGGKLEIFLPGLETERSGNPPEGDGVNPRSRYTFANLFEIRNQGDDPVEVYSRQTQSELGDTTPSPPGIDISLTGGPDAQLLFTEANAIKLTPGERISAGIFVVVRDVQPEEFETKFVIVADQPQQTPSS